jgi:phage/conjugal plasmid C-4 type zinc finger TraR family protein
MDDADIAQVRETAERNAGIARVRSAAAHQRQREGRRDCFDCGDEIPAARRRAVPGAVRCTGCQRAFDYLRGNI